MPYTLTTGLALNAAGLTLTAQLVDTAGANTGAAIATGFVDLGAGYYQWTNAAIPDAFRGVVKFLDGATLKAIVAINPQEAENLDVKVSTRLGNTTGGTITYVNPVAVSGDITLVKGDDYNATDGRSLEWFTSDTATWPDLTGATITVTVASQSGVSTFTANGTVVTATGANKRVRVEPTAANTNALTPQQQHHFDVQATLASARSVTLVRGNCNVLQGYAT